MSKIWTKEDIEKIFEDIQQFAIEIERSTFCNTEEVDEKQKVYVFIGDKAYPQNRAVSPSIILPFAFYSNLKFSEVAFLSNSRYKHKKGIKSP
mgnify:CR=1 FL=1